MTIYRHSFGVCSLGFNSARQMLHVVNQNNSKARLLSTKVPCQEFNNLWNSYISGTVDVTDFLEQIQIHQQDLELRHQSLTMVAVATFDRPEEYYQTIMGIFHALDCLCQVPQAASAIKLLLIGLTKTGADKFNLIKLFPEQKVESHSLYKEYLRIKFIFPLLSYWSKCRNLFRSASSFFCRFYLSYCYRSILHHCMWLNICVPTRQT